jgi:signal transduction histidine kinase
MKKERESLLEYEDVLSLAPGVIDEYGIPVSLYAADQLLQSGSHHELVVERIGAQLESGVWLSPAGVYLMKDILEKAFGDAPETAGASLRAVTEDCLRRVLGLILTTEQGLSLKDDYPHLGLEPFAGTKLNGDKALWVSYGQTPWLVGLSAPLPDRAVLLAAVDFQAFSSSYLSNARGLSSPARDFDLVTGFPADGTALGSAFPGLSIVFGTGAEEAYSKQWSLQRLFYFIALVVVLSVTLFGAYLLWRDVRREVRLAEMRSQFVSSVSHELKTPLTAIRMFAETLRLGRLQNRQTREEYIDTIVNESERLTRLLNNVLDFSKIEKGKKTYRPLPASLPEVIGAAARAMEYPLSQQGFKLNVEVEEDLPDVCVDRDALEQAVLNLLHNAMKYSGDSREIDLRLRKSGRLAVIQVIDRGVGIAAQERKKIFEKFYRVPSAENDRLPGTGLGLSLVKHIVAAHGGRVEVESAPGKGSTFSIFLPLEKGG